MSATTWTCDSIKFICDDCGQRFGAELASSSYEATRCIPCHKTHVANVYRAYDQRLSAFGDLDEIEADCTAADMDQDERAEQDRMFDERDGLIADLARLQTWADQRLAMTSADEVPF